LRKEKRHERSASRKALELYGVPNVKIYVLGGETGWPDRQYFIPGGRSLLIEYKEVGEEPTPKQVYIHDMLKGLGYDVIWCDTEAEALAAIRARVEASRISKERR
jgi:hypothetical protein